MRGSLKFSLRGWYFKPAKVWRIKSQPWKKRGRYVNILSLGKPCRTQGSWRREWQPTPEFLHEEFHGLRSLAGYIQSMRSQRVTHDWATLTHSCPLSQWCHPTISSSVPHFSSCPQSFPASESFKRSGDQRIGASASVLPMNSQGWFPLGLTGLVSLLSKEVSLYFVGWGDICQVQALLPRIWGPSLSQFYKISLCSNLLSL